MSTKTVLVPFPIDKPYDYGLSATDSLPLGSYVSVPLGQRVVTGVVWGEGRGGVAPAKLKDILHVNDATPPLSEAHRKFIDWVARYTMNPLGSILKLTLSVPAALEDDKVAVGYITTNKSPDKLKPVQQRVMGIAADGLARRASELAEEAGCTTSVIKTLHKNGYLRDVALKTNAPCRYPDAARTGATLSGAQKSAADHLVKSVEAQKFSASLLDGVTGSGKTEVYFEAVAQAIKQDKQVLILLPEIALSNAFLDRFKSRFGCAPALWHSSLSQGARKRTWRGVANNESKVVVGARSALFLPFADLGLIIVDEEHDPAYKQEEGTLYHARDMAVVRAHLGAIPIALISATPSLETMQNV